MTVTRSIISGFFLLSTVIGFGQVNYGTGLNIGRNNGGVEYQVYSLDRLKVFSGANLRKYNSFSIRAGAGFSIRPLTKKHNIWINSSFEYKFASTPVLVKDDVNYTYHVNRLNYWNIEAAYSFKIDKYFDQGRFILLEAKLISKQLLTKLHLEPSVNNIAVNLSDESRLRQYFYSGTSLSIGIKFIW